MWDFDDCFPKIWDLAPKSPAMIFHDIYIQFEQAKEFVLPNLDEVVAEMDRIEK